MKSAILGFRFVVNLSRSILPSAFFLAWMAWGSMSSVLSSPIPMQVSEDGVEPRVGNTDGEKLSDTNAWGMSRRVSWGERVQDLRPTYETPYALGEAFPILRFKNLSDVGAFPAFGLLWGIENDLEGNHGSVWQWHDQLQASQKALFLEFDRHVVGVAFPSDFESNGNVYVATLGKKLRDGLRQLEVLQFRLQTKPPFRLKTDRATVVARAGIRTLREGILRAATDGTIFVELSEGETLLAASVTVRIKELPKAVWNIELIFDAVTGDIRERNDESSTQKEGLANEQDSNSTTNSVWGVVRVEPRLLLRDFSGTVAERSLHGPWNRDVSIGGCVIPSGSLGTRTTSVAIADTSSGDIWGAPIRANQGSPVLIARTSCKLRRIGVDSNDEPLFIDVDGRVLRLYKRLDETQWTMPGLLSETGWYTEIATGQMDPKFVQFAKGKALEGHGDSQDYWVCVPLGETIDASKPGRWRFPDGTLLVQTLYSKVGDRDSVEARKRMETRVLLRMDLEWFAYSYRWNEDESDALLVPNEGLQNTTATASKGTWEVPSRTQCNLCHIPNGRGYRLSFRHETFAAKSRLAPVQAQLTLPELTELGVLGPGPIRLARPRGGIRQSNQANLVTDLDRMLMGKANLIELDTYWFSSSLLLDNLTHWLKASKPSTGAFHVNLDSSWNALPQPHSTILSQGNLLYVMSIGTTTSYDKSFQEAVIRGADFILEHYVDPKFGGFYESVDSLGEKIDGTKNLEGQATAILGLAYASQATGRKQYLDSAVKAWSQLKIKLYDPKRGWSTQASEDFSQQRKCSQRALLRAFEALVMILDITGSESIAEDAEELADFVLNQLWREPGFLAEEYEENWTSPIPMEDGKIIEIGNQAKWAFLLSESVRVGLPRRFLTWGQRLYDYVLIYGLDVPTGTIGEPGNTQNRGAWQQAEFLRMLIRYADLHGREVDWPKAKHLQQYIKRSCLDQAQGGWIEVGTSDKGNLKKTGEHEVGMYLEGIRLAGELQQRKETPEQ